jgi:hypothetical protein
VAPAPAPVADWTVGIPDNIVAAINAVGGPDSPGGAALVAQFAPKAAPAPEPEPEPVDPFAGLPAHVQIAVDGAGGIESAPGYAVYVALGGTAAQPAAGTAAATKRKRRTKAEIEADNAKAAAATQPQVIAPAPAAAVTQPAAPSLATPPAAGLGAGIDALLAQAMATPTA